MSRAFRVLYIEDDMRLRKLLYEDLRESGYAVMTAPDAREGIQAFFNFAPSLVLCDIRMPQISGFDLFERMLKLDSRCFGAAFIFLTALADRDNELRGRRLGADDYITKPVDEEILREVVRMRLSTRSMGVAPAPLTPEIRAALLGWFDGPGGKLPDGLQEKLGRQFHRTLGDMPVSAEALDHIAVGIVILNVNGGIAYANESAAEAFGKPRTDLLGRRAPEALAALARRHLADAKGNFGVLSAAHIAMGGDAGELPVIARLTSNPDGLQPQRVTILIPHLSGVAAVLNTLLFRLYGLTPAECGLASELAGSTTLANAALRRGVALDTVRTQLRSIFLKMNISRQSDLVSAVLKLQMIAGGCK